MTSVTKALSVLLIDDNPARAEIVESGLRDAGYVLLERLGVPTICWRASAALKPDVIVVSIDSPSRDAIEDLRRTTEKQPRPIALFADVRIRRRLPPRWRLVFPPMS
jgi:response regulator NasT